MCNALIYDWVLLLPDEFKFIALDHVPIEPMEAIAIFYSEDQIYIYVESIINFLILIEQTCFRDES